MDMSTHRWINQTQPPSLVNATILLYLNAALALIFMDVLLVLKLIGIAGAFGIANEKKWGYYVASGVAIIPLTLTLLFMVTGQFSSRGFVDLLITLLFQLLLVGLLFHPASRSYQRIWFK